MYNTYMSKKKLKLSGRTTPYTLLAMHTSVAELVRKTAKEEELTISESLKKRYP